MPAHSPSPNTTASYDRLEHRGIYQRQVAEREEEFVVNSLRRELLQSAMGSGGFFARDDSRATNNSGTRKNHPTPSRNILEIGSGTGRFTRHLQQLATSLVATDVSEEMLDKTRRRLGEATGVSYQVSNIADLPKLTGYGRFHAAVAMRVIPHCDDWQAALKIVASAVRPGGLVLLDLWSRRSFVAWLLRKQQYDDLELVHRLEPIEIREAVEQLPCKVIDTLRWGYPRLGPLQADGLFALLLPQRAYSTTFCLRSSG